MNSCCKLILLSVLNIRYFQMCVSYSALYNKLTQPLWLKTLHIYYLSFWVPGIWAHRSLVLYFRVSYRLQSRCWPGRGHVKGAGCWLGHNAFPSSCNCWQDSAPRGYWAESFNSLLAVDWRLPSVPGHVGLSKMSACFIRECKPTNQGLAWRWKSQTVVT